MRSLLAELRPGAVRPVRGNADDRPSNCHRDDRERRGSCRGHRVRRSQKQQPVHGAARGTDQHGKGFEDDEPESRLEIEIPDADKHSPQDERHSALIAPSRVTLASVVQPRDSANHSAGIPTSAAEGSAMAAAMIAASQNIGIVTMNATTGVTRMSGSTLARPGRGAAGEAVTRPMILPNPNRATRRSCGWFPLCQPSVSNSASARHSRRRA